MALVNSMCELSHCLISNIMLFVNQHFFFLLLVKLRLYILVVQCESSNATIVWYPNFKKVIWKPPSPLFFFFTKFWNKFWNTGFLKWRSPNSNHTSLYQSLAPQIMECHLFTLLSPLHKSPQFSLLCHWWTTFCWSVFNFVCVCLCSSLLPRHPTGPLHLCLNVDSRWSCDCHSLPSQCSAKHWSLHISCSVLRKPSSTDAAAELISSKSMTKSLWKHFYLCVCLCG